MIKDKTEVYVRLNEHQGTITIDGKQTIVYSREELEGTLLMMIKRSNNVYIGFDKNASVFFGDSEICFKPYVITDGMVLTFNVLTRDASELFYSIHDIANFKNYFLTRNARGQRRKVENFDVITADAFGDDTTWKFIQSVLEYEGLDVKNVSKETLEKFATILLRSFPNYVENEMNYRDVKGKQKVK